MTKIQWTNETWNPVTGCTRVSAGCDNCYAARLAATRLKHTRQYEGLATITKSGRVAFNGTIRLLPERLDQPLRWRKPRMIFVNSMSDLFHEDIPDEYIAAVFGVMAAAPRHTFQVLTKRPERMREWFAWLEGLAVRSGALFSADDADLWPLPNVWLGVSCEDQATADERIPHLLVTPAAVRFVSAEPLLGPVDLAAAAGVTYWDDPSAGLHWCIVGGESGPGARPFDLAWARQIVEQCREAGVATFCKQFGSRPVVSDATCPLERAMREGGYRFRDRNGGDPAEWPEDLRVREFPV